MKRKNWNQFINVAAPILIGAVLYYLFCPDTIFVGWIDKWMGVSRHLNFAANFAAAYPVIRVIRNHLFDFLWAYSLMCTALLLMKESADMHAGCLVIGSVIMFEIIMEGLQILPSVKGTFDIFDLAVEGIADILVIRKNRRR